MALHDATSRLRRKVKNFAKNLAVDLKRILGSFGSVIRTMLDVLSQKEPGTAAVRLPLRTASMKGGHVSAEAEVDVGVIKEV